MTEIRCASSRSTSRPRSEHADDTGPVYRSDLGRTPTAELQGQDRSPMTATTHREADTGDEGRSRITLDHKSTLPRRLASSSFCSRTGKCRNQYRPRHATGRRALGDRWVPLSGARAVDRFGFRIRERFSRYGERGRDGHLHAFLEAGRRGPLVGDTGSVLGVGVANQRLGSGQDATSGVEWGHAESVLLAGMLYALFLELVRITGNGRPLRRGIAHSR